MTLSPTLALLFPSIATLYDIEMAVKPSSGVLKLEEQLTCPVCLDLYTDPKTLPCLHSFCQECLKGLPQEREARGDTYYLSCPTCRQRTEVPIEGVGAFPVAFQLKNLKEIAQSLKNEVSDPQQVTCNDHDKPLDMFCVTCETVICHYCAFHTHKDHKHALISDCYPKHYQMLHDSLKPVKGKKQTLKKVLSDLAEREGQIRKRGEGVLEEIHQMVEEMIGILRQSERKLTEQVKRVTDAKLQVLSGQTKSVQTSLNLLEDVEDYVEQSLKTGTHQQVLSSKKQMMEHMSEVTAQINVEELRPIEKDDLRLIKDSAEALKSLHHIGTVSYTALQECKVKIFEVEKSLKEKKVSFSLSMEAQDSSLVSVPVSSLRCSLVPVGKGDQPIHTTVTTTSTHPGVYRIHCNPLTHGTHTVKVQVYDVQLEDTSLFIPFNPCLDNITPVRTITGLYSPWRVAVSDDGHVIVTERGGNCVTILDNEGKKVKSFGGKGEMGDVKFSSPRGIAITPDNIILVSDVIHGIQKISMDGDCIASVGGKGSGPLQFDGPNGIAISPITGQVYIADRNNHRIQVLNPDLTFSHSFGKEGSANGKFQRSCDIAIDSQGLVYVTDAHNHCIQKFTPNGKFVAQFGSEGSGPGQLKYPYGITIDTAGTGLVYVSEITGHRVSVFTSDGVFVSSFGRYGSNIDQFKYPRGLKFDKEGFLHVCDYGNKRLVIY